MYWAISINIPINIKAHIRYPENVFLLAKNVHKESIKYPTKWIIKELEVVATLPISARERRVITKPKEIALILSKFSIENTEDLRKKYVKRTDGIPRNPQKRKKL